MNKTTLSLAALVVLNLVALSALVFSDKDTATVVAPDGTKTQVAVGGTSPDLQSPWFTFGGVRNWAGKTTSLQQATTTICVLQAPAATSSLQFASLKLTVSSTTASNINFGSGVTPYAIGTSLGGGPVAANSNVDIVATSSLVFSPNHYFVVKMTGGVGTFSPTGVCQAQWVEL